MKSVSYNFPQNRADTSNHFLGSAAVLATLAPQATLASDAFEPLIEIWRTLHDDVDLLIQWYSDRRQAMMAGDKVTEYEKIKASYNSRPNGADFLFLCRSCYGGVVRFRKADGYMSTPCGAHTPIGVESFCQARDQNGRQRTIGAQFRLMDYSSAMQTAVKGDLVYCDPPYRDSQAILYGAQEF